MRIQVFGLVAWAGLLAAMLPYPRAAAGEAPAAEPTRQMKISQGDLSAATNETERFYALGRAARNALEY
jgi:hypothetical protein